MIFTDPIGFDGVEQLIKDKKIKVTGLSSAQISKLRDQFNIRGNFSAKTLNAQLLQGYQDRLMSASQENIATMRAQMKDLIDALEIAPPSEEEAGTITDLGSNARIGLKLRTDLSMARGYGQYTEGMTEGALQAFPALELIRVEDRRVPREWFEIWDDAADELGDETTATSAEETGRMVAVKGDPIWLEISDFGQPWPPFQFNSGMGVEDVDYEDAVDLGVIDPDDIVPQPEAMDFNEGIESSVAQLAPEIVNVLDEGLEGIAERVGDAFRMITQPKQQPKIVNEAQAIRDRMESVLALMANMGTHEGGIKGWITRRGEGPLSAKRIERMRVRHQVKQGREALRRALATGENQNDAMQIPGTGSVDFDFGRPGNVQATKDDGYGISHIQAKHPEQMNRLPLTLAKGQIIPHEDSKKLYVVYKNNVAILQQKERGDGSFSQSRYGVISHYQDMRKARELSPASLSNSRQMLSGEFLSLGGYASRPTGVADGEGCCQDFQFNSAAALRQRASDVLELLEEAA
ncbi:MAG: hypothetical protein LV479_08350 [Methylacidiphilales bacterium]|nr:hypothetical protein [Candidatus Methylacidiphilales bacterium]